MAIAFDAVSTDNPGSKVNSSSFSHTCTGSDRYLVLAVTKDGNSIPTSVTVTYNSVAMTLIGSHTGDRVQTLLYGLINPATGSNTVAWSASGTADFITLSAVSYTGVHQTTPTSGYTDTGKQGSNTAPTEDVTSATNDLVFACISFNADPTCSPGTGLTERSDQNSGGGPGSGHATYDKAGETTCTMDGTLSASNFWTVAGFSMAPAAGSTEYDKNFTADAVLVQDDIDKTFTTDAIIKKSNIDKTFTADAILKATQTKTFTVDAILKKADNDKTFTSDALLQVIDNDKTFTADAILTTTGSATFTVDAILKKSDNDKTLTTDAILKKADNDKTFTIDSILTATGSKTLTVDSILKKADNDKTFDVDSILKQSNIDKTLTADSILKKADNDKTLTADAILKKSNIDKTFTVDAVLDAGAVDKTFTVDAILKKADNDKTFTVDAILQSARRRWAPFGKKEKEYFLNICAPVIKESSLEIEIVVPVKINKQRELKVGARIFKQHEMIFKISSKVNSKKLFEILDAI